MVATANLFAVLALAPLLLLSSGVGPVGSVAAWTTLVVLALHATALWCTPTGGRTNTVGHRARVLAVVGTTAVGGFGMYRAGGWASVAHVPVLLAATVVLFLITVQLVADHDRASLAGVGLLSAA